MRFRRAFNSLRRLLAARDFRGIVNRVNLSIYTVVDSGLLGRLVRYVFLRADERPQISFVKMSGPSPKVSVIVPNYNHAPYLKKRLDSIYGQTYRNFEVILLDDCSTDDSRTILNDYQSRYPEITKTYFNDKNAGSLSRQWAKGMGLARGDLVWIAESDDYCDRNFLETLVPLFADESVQIAYSRTVFVDSNERPIWTTERYLADLDGVRWKKPYINTAADEVARFFSRKNLIANASSAIIRKPHALPLLSQESWLKLKICADWIFYLNIIRGGSIAYSPATQNYYRRHEANTSSSTLYQQDFYYREHQMVGENLVRLYNVGDEAIEGLYKKAKWDWSTNCAGRSLSDFEQLFDKRAIALSREGHRPNIAICGYAFSGGGAETFPIRLANSLKTRGHSVLFINFDFERRNDRVRAMLHAGIPVVNLVSSNIFSKVAELRLNLEAFRIDLINSHHFQVDRLIGRYCADLDVKHVVTMHGLYEMADDATLEKDLPELERTVAAWIYAAEKNLSSFKRFGHYNEAKFYKIGNALELRSVSGLSRQQFGISESAFVACLVSRAIKEKGWFEAIDAVTRAREISGKDIHLLLIGEGLVYEQIKGNTPPYIHRLGFREDVPECFATSDIGLLPSYFSGESFPLVILDCLMANRPVVASDIAEIRAMLTSPTGEVAGTVFDLENGGIPVEKLAQIIADYASDSELYQQKSKLAGQVSKKFDISAMTEKYESAYMRVLDKTPVMDKN